MSTLTGGARQSSSRASQRRRAAITAKGTGLAHLLRPRLSAAGASPSEACEAAQLIVYAFRGTLVSCAHGLISDECFRADSELATKRLILGTFGIEDNGGRHE